MHHIRPYKLFTSVEGAPSDTIVQTVLPRGRASGGLKLLEMFVLLAASRLVEAKRLFEFGTFLGNTTLNLALNIPDDGKIFTLDLGQQHVGAIKQDVEDAPLTEIHLAAQSSLEFIGNAVEHKVTTLTGNSTVFDFSRWHESIDLVFIDGGHDLATVRSDSENALRMACDNKPSCILWHDYRNPFYSGLTYYLDELSQQLELVHIEETMICAWFNDPGNVILSKLLS